MVNHGNLGLPLALAIAGLAGCSAGPLPTYPVQGKVQFADGSPLPAGSVECRALAPEAQGVNARGEIAADGSFRLTTFSKGDGAVAGEHEVLVVPQLSDISIGEQPAPPEPIDRRFQRYETSGLRCTVVAGQDNACTLIVAPPGK